MFAICIILTLQHCVNEVVLLLTRLDSLINAFAVFSKPLSLRYEYTKGYRSDGTTVSDEAMLNYYTWF